MRSSLNIAKNDLERHRRRRRETKILRRKPARCRMAPGRPALWVGKGGAPRELTRAQALLGMTKMIISVK